MTTHSQTFEAVIQAAELIKSTEEKNRTREKAVKLKQENIILWDNALKERKQRFWHTLMNANKSRLYTRWDQETPEFIPRKFRPKLVLGENPEITEIRIGRAKHEFRSNILQMETYSTIHRKKLEVVEESMTQFIADISPTTAVKEELTELWRMEVAESEEKSVQIWNMKERFLNKKRHDEMLNNSYQLADETWQEVLQNKSTNNRIKFKKKKQISSEQQSPTESDQAV